MTVRIAATAVLWLMTASASNFLLIDPEGKLVEGEWETLARKLGQVEVGQSP